MPLFSTMASSQPLVHHKAGDQQRDCEREEHEPAPVELRILVATAWAVGAIIEGVV
jgi:hypothetical protein